MSSSRKTKQGFDVNGCFAGTIAIAFAALVAGPATAQDARQRATFTVQGSTVIGLSGLTTGVVDTNNPNNSKLTNVQLSQQAIGAFEVGYTGTVTADISFNPTTHVITGINVANASFVPGVSANWKPGNWDPNKYAPNGKDWKPTDPPAPPVKGQLGGFPNNGADSEAANYGGTVAGLINFALRGSSLNISNRGTVFSVAPNGNFTVTGAQKLQFTGGFVDIYSAVDGGGLAEDHDDTTAFKNVEVNPAAVQPATFDYTDGTGTHTLANPLAGQPYPSNIVWRYVTSSTTVPVFDANHNPIMNGATQLTTKIITYGALAPGFETTKGGLQSGAFPANLDKQWFDTNDGAIGKPDVSFTYVPSKTWFDAAGNPLMVQNQAELANLGGNLKDVVYDDFGNIVSSTPVSSNISATLNAGTGKYDSSLAMNMDASLALFIGDFAVSFKLGQAQDIFQQLTEGTGRIFADGSLSLKAGDVNNDGIVNIFDINLVSANWSPQANPDFYAGDANGDGAVNIFDINLISANWTPVGATAVPEPSTLVLAALGGVAIAWNFYRRRCV